MKQLRAYLVIAANGAMRLRQSPPPRTVGEIYYRLNVSMPDAWGLLQGSIDITMPEPPAAEISVEEAEPEQ